MAFRDWQWSPLIRAFEVAEEEEKSVRCAAERIRPAMRLRILICYVFI